MTVRQMLAAIDSRELSEWAAYERVAGPLGPERADMHAAVIASTVANVMRSKGSAMKIEDFLPSWDEDAPQDWQQQLATVKQITAAMGGDHRGHDR